MKINENTSFGIILVLSVLFLIVGNFLATRDFQREEDPFAATYYTGVITEILRRDETETEMGAGFFAVNTEIEFLVRITRGERRGEIITAHQFLSTMWLTDEAEVEAGNRVILFYDEFGERFFFANLVRINSIAVLGAVFLVLVILFARRKGFNAIIALMLTCFAIFVVFIPAILAGRNIYVATIIVCVYAVVTGLLLVCGVNKKAFSAMLGCLGGVFAASVLMLFMDNILSLTGIFDEETQILIFMLTDNPINARAIVFAGVVLGAVGAIMDVAMSMSSSLWELRQAGGVNDFSSLIKSGVSIGRDILGTMLNTLVLAYIGSSLSLILLITANATNMMDLLNMELIIVEFLRALVGSMGMLLTIPLTAAVCGWLYGAD